MVNSNKEVLIHYCEFRSIRQEKWKRKSGYIPSFPNLEYNQIVYHVKYANIFDVKIDIICTNILVQTHMQQHSCIITHAQKRYRTKF